MGKIGKNIKKIRNVKGMSQQAFADLFDLSRGNISSYEELRAEPKIDIIIRIANFFSIPLTDFIEKDLSINELLHYNTDMVLEPERHKIAQQLVKIPYVPTLYIPEYIACHKDVNYIQNLPYIIVPSNTKSHLVAIEVDNQDTLPIGLEARNGDILIYEYVNKEIIHRIGERFGIMLTQDEIKYGVFKEDRGSFTLSLNDFVNYPFDIERNEYLVLRATYQQIF